MIFCADTSFLISFYLVDANSAIAKRIIRNVQPTLLPLTNFGEFELKNAVEGLIFRKTITISEAGVALRAIEHDTMSGFLAPTLCLWEDVFSTADSLSQRHTQLIGCRALDILHVAIAIVLGCTDFLTFDQRQARLAQQAGLATHP